MLNFSGTPYWQNTYKKLDGKFIQGELIPNEVSAKMLARQSALGKYVNTLYLEDTGKEFIGQIIIFNLEEKL